MAQVQGPAHAGPCPCRHLQNTLLLHVSQSHSRIIRHCFWDLNAGSAHCLLILIAEPNTSNDAVCECIPQACKEWRIVRKREWWISDSGQMIMQAVEQQRLCL